MATKENIAIFWFRRDLRLNDNLGFYKALTSGKKVLPLFIFDTDIIESLPKNDARVSFIYDLLEELSIQFKKHDSSLLIKHGRPIEIWRQLIEEYNISEVYYNEDYEPYGIERDEKVDAFFQAKNIAFKGFKDHIIMHPNEVLKDDRTPYAVYTPYSKKWKNLLADEHLSHYPSEKHLNQLLLLQVAFPKLKDIGFSSSPIKVRPCRTDGLANFKKERDFPAVKATSEVSPHLRFGSVSLRELIKKTRSQNEHYLNELIWREFFIQVLYHFPKVVSKSFKSKYDNIEWRNNEAEFERWKKGETGYPIVDAGMRELNETGYMHNRVRMIVASFLCKDLLIDWRWGEAYFAEKLLDFELASNNGNWQWVSGTGCDAAPYFRVFNPYTQQEKFDPEGVYIKKWVKDLNELTYPAPMVDHKKARIRALETYKEAL